MPNGDIDETILCEKFYQLITGNVCYVLDEKKVLSIGT